MPQSGLCCGACCGARFVVGTRSVCSIVGRQQQRATSRLPPSFRQVVIIYSSPCPRSAIPSIENLFPHDKRCTGLSQEEQHSCNAPLFVPRLDRAAKSQNCSF